VTNLEKRIDIKWILDEAKDHILVRADIVIISQTDSDINARGRKKIRIEALTSATFQGVNYLGHIVQEHMHPWREGEFNREKIFAHECDPEKLTSTLLTSPLWSPAHPLMGDRRRVVITDNGPLKVPTPRLVLDQMIRIHDRLSRNIRHPAIFDLRRRAMMKPLATRLIALYEELCSP
jgi:hypothetical protein